MNEEEKAKSRAGAKKIEVREKLEEMCDSLSDFVLTHIPEDVAEHLCNSKKEFLMAVKSILDKEIERTERKKERSKELHKEK